MIKKNRTIGVIGYRGTVGQKIISLLENKYCVIKGTRNKSVQGENIFYVDAYDDDSLVAFCKKCRVVINAAGPSYIIGDRIAKVALTEKAKYVDIFGGNLLRDQISAYQNKGRFIICAGSIPGLSGILINYLMKKSQLKYQRIDVYQGGREAGGLAGLSDIILSMMKGYGYSGKQIVNSKITNFKQDMSNKILIDNIPEPVYVNPYLTEEVISVAKDCHKGMITSYQIFPDKKSMDLLTEGSMRYISSQNKVEKARILSDICKRQEQLISGKEKWFILLLNAENEVKKWRILVKAKDSVVLTALIAAMSAEQLIVEEDQRGLSWAYELLEGADVIKRIKDIKEEIKVEYSEENISCVEMVEGTL